MATAAPSTTTVTDPALRQHWVRIGWWCIAVSLAWNVAEGVVCVWAGQLADSVALLGFGIDSFIETASAAVIVWRLLAERRGELARAARVEKAAGRWMAVLLGILALYIAAESARRLLGFGEEARESPVGLAITAASIIVMPLLFAAKRRVARELDSSAVRADGVQTIACWWLSIATFGGLGLNAWLGWSWADPLAALALIPFIIKEARSAWAGQGCGCAADRCEISA